LVSRLTSRTRSEAVISRQALTRTRSILPSIKEGLSDGLASYTRTLVALLAEAGIAVSPRRAGMLFRSALAVNAACMASDPAIPASEATLLAIKNALPQPAQGITVPPLKLLAAHRDAWRLANISPDDPLKAILCAATPIERFRLAVEAPGLAKSEFSRVVADTLAQLPLGGREAAVVYLFETGAVGRLNAAVAGMAAELYRHVAAPPEFTESLHPSNPRFQAWSKLKNLMSQLDRRDPRAHLRANAVAASFARGELPRPPKPRRHSRLLPRRKHSCRGRHDAGYWAPPP
jgi:hypothetical protein